MKKILSFCAVLLMACSVNAQAQTNAQQNASDAKAGQAQLLPWYDCSKDPFLFCTIPLMISYPSRL
jgi:hypothetical protein